MSIAGNPGKMTELGKKVLALILEEIDERNVPDYTNAEIFLEEIIRKLRAARRKRLKQMRGK